MFVLVSEICSVPYHKVARIIQPVFQPQAAANPVLDLGCPRLLFKLGGEVCIPITTEDTIHILLYNRYK